MLHYRVHEMYYSFLARLDISLNMVFCNVTNNHLDVRNTGNVASLCINWYALAGGETVAVESIYHLMK